MLKNSANIQIYEELKRILPELNILVDEPMRKHTTFKIGGPADFLIMPSSINDIREIIKYASMRDIPLTVLGNGSNMLVLDGGIRGIVIKISHNFNYISHDDEMIIAGAGTMLTYAAYFASKHNLTGMEFAVGIPGSIGGAVFMNAGAYDGEMSYIVKSVLAISPEGKPVRFYNEQMNFGYRHSIFQDNNYIICEVQLELKHGDYEAIKNKMDDYTSRRLTKQPMDMPSAGSTFKRPNGYYAGTLIEQAGLKGMKVGGAQVSEKHAGFIVNIGDATAQDVINLISNVQKNVYDKFGVKLQPEIKIVGEH